MSIKSIREAAQLKAKAIKEEAEAKINEIITKADADIQKYKEADATEREHIVRHNSEMAGKKIKDTAKSTLNGVVGFISNAPGKTAVKGFWNGLTK